MLDLMRIARTEADSGDLLGLLQDLFDPSEIRPAGSPEAVIWQRGHHDGKVNPVAHSLTDAYALLGTIAAIDILGLPFYAVPMWSQYRHDMELAPLSWFGNMPCTSIKWSTAGDAYVNDSSGKKVVVMPLGPAMHYAAATFRMTLARANICWIRAMLSSKQWYDPSNAISALVTSGIGSGQSPIKKSSPAMLILIITGLQQ